MSIAAEVYDKLQADPARWLQTAQGLMLSAKLSWDAASPLMKGAGPIKPLVAYWNSFLLLTAFAFENVYRASIVAQGGNWRDALKDRGGHALLRHTSSLTELTDEEAQLVERLETYLIWAGRYAVPLNVQAYIGASEKFLQSLRGSDFQTAIGLFGRLERLVIDQIQKQATP